MPHLYIKYNSMKKITVIFICITFLLLTSNCQTIKEKTSKIVEKENKNLSKYIGKNVDNLKMNLGKPNEDFKNEKGNLEFIYTTKKYGIPCERRFEIDSNFIVIGFISKGCF